MASDSCCRVATELLSSYLARVEIYTSNEEVRHYEFTVFYVTVNDSKFICTLSKPD